MVKTREHYSVQADGTIDRHAWLSHVCASKTALQSELITAACELAYQLYQHNLTPLGLPYLHQSIVMAEILNNLGLDAETIAASLIYLAVRHHLVSLATVKLDIGDKVGQLIEELNDLKLLQLKSKIVMSRNSNLEAYVHNLRRMLLAVVNDVRVVFIKLAEHTCEMRMASKLSLKIQQQLSLETQTLYAPLANRLGIGQIKWELEDLTFRFLEPLSYQAIAKLVDEKRIDREQFIETIISEIEQVLNRQGIVALFHGRAKHIYSIWRKMQRKGVSFNQIYDAQAIRILVPTLQDCYATLGVVHTLWVHIAQEFDDYIANPKNNGYQSIHTAVFGPKGKILEIQIRTHQMHEQAELGVAAHWRYKEGIQTVALKQDKKIIKLREILSWQQDLPHLVEAAKSLQAEFSEERVYVLSPKGEIIDLPFGATPIDYSYYLHTELGHRTKGAKINNKIVPLNYQLKNGDQIEILSAKEGRPSRDWVNPHLSYLKTARAKAKVYQWLRKQNREDNIRQGQLILERELSRLHFKKFDYKLLCQALKIDCTKELYAQIGIGQFNLSHALLKLQSSAAHSDMPISPIKIKTSQSKDLQSELIVGGLGNLMCHLAKCCKPIPGDEIGGYISLGRGISVHRQDCLNFLSMIGKNNSRSIEVKWGQSIKNLYQIDLFVKAYDRQGLLKDVSLVLSQEKVNVLSVNALSNIDQCTAELRLKLELSGLAALDRVLTHIHNLPNVTEVYRKIDNTSLQKSV